MTQQRVARQSVDIVLKLIAMALGGDLFARFGVPLPPIVDALPTELPQLEVRTQHTDQLFRLADDSILHLEFQTTRRSGDLIRFAAYNLAVFQYYGRPVFTVVLYGPGIRNARDTLPMGSLTFRTQNILIGKEDGEAVLQRLREKAARGEPLDPADRVDLIFAPLMRQRRPAAEILREVVPLTGRLPMEQQELTVSALLGLAYHYVDEAIVQAILEELSMANPLITMFEERETKGELNGARRALRTVLRARFGALPESAEQRIDAADAPRLDELLSRAATAQDIDELWR